SGADVDTSNSITSLARNNDSILDPIQSSGTQQQKQNIQGSRLQDATASQVLSINSLYTLSLAFP
ncbi:MAG: hypothetical protein, partial [Olavius algarvensis Gamma 1 endosymbiont]